MALRAVERLRGWEPGPGAYALVESAEVVLIDGHIGLDVRWTHMSIDQGRRRFGLLTTVHDLMEDADTHDGNWAAEALLIAVQEPHASPRDELRLIFRRLP